MEQLFQVAPRVFAHAPGSTAHVLHRDYETRSQAILKREADAATEAA
jgi:hypothetical protein